MKDRLFQTATVIMVLSAIVIFLWYQDCTPEKYQEQLQPKETVLEMEAESKTGSEAEPKTEPGGLKEEDNIIIDLPDGVDEKDIYLFIRQSKQQVRIQFPLKDKGYFREHPIHGNGEHIKNYEAAVSATCGSVILTLDGLYQTEGSVMENQLLLSFSDLAEQYEHLVIIDAAHGGTDTGNTAAHAEEKDLTLAISRQVMKYKEELEKKGIGVLFTRTKDDTLSIQERLLYAKNADLFISIHINTNNDPDASGIQAFLSRAGNEESKAAAEICISSLCEKLKTSNDSVFLETDSKLLSNMEIPAFEIQIGFISNPKELKNLKTKEYQKKAAAGIKNAILEYFEKGLEET